MTKPYQVRDPFFLRAKAEGYRARSAYKLKDIQNKFKIMQKGDSVLDLGAAPGSFMQVISETVGPEGKVYGIDLQEIEVFDLPGIIIMQGDIFNHEPLLDFFKNKAPIDVITSDLAPKTSGIRDMDQGLSIELAEQAYLIAEKLLKPGGHFIAKVFEGEDLQHLLKKVRKKFKKVTLFKPPSCRDRSFETYLVAMHKNN